MVKASVCSAAIALRSAIAANVSCQGRVCPSMDEVRGGADLEKGLKNEPSLLDSALNIFVYVTSYALIVPEIFQLCPELS